MGSIYGIVEAVMTFYTGVGSRQTPEDIQMLMRACSRHFEKEGMILRSGGATGADTAFQEGLVQGKQKIYIPWNGFNKLREDPQNGIYLATKLEKYHEAKEIAATHYKKWLELKDFIKNLHARNVFQMIGENLDDPSKFVLFWAEPYKEHGLKGGTGFAVKIARAYKIPLYNLYDEGVRKEFSQRVQYQSDF